MTTTRHRPPAAVIAAGALTGALLSGGLLSGCGQATEPAPGGPSVVTPTLGGAYQLSSLQIGGQDQPLVDPTSLVVDAEYGSLALDTSCGEQLGAYSLLSDGRAGVTLAGGRSGACSPTAKRQQDDVTATLAQVSAWSQGTNGALVLTSPSGDVVTFVR